MKKMMVGSKRDETLEKTNLRGGVFFDKQMVGYVGWKTLDMSYRPDTSEQSSVARMKQQPVHT